MSILKKSSNPKQQDDDEFENIEDCMNQHKFSHCNDKAHIENIECMFSIMKTRPRLFIEEKLEQHFEGNKKVNEFCWQVNVTKKEHIGGKDFYTIQIKHPKQSFEIVKRFSDFVKFSEALRQDFSTTAYKLEFFNKYPPGYHVIPYFEKEAFSPATDEDFIERKEKMRYFLLQILSHSVLSIYPLTQAFLAEVNFILTLENRH